MSENSLGTMSFTDLGVKWIGVETKKTGLGRDLKDWIGI